MRTHLTTIGLFEVDKVFGIDLNKLYCGILLDVHALVELIPLRKMLYLHLQAASLSTMQDSDTCLSRNFN